MERLQKLIAQAGIASRRAAEELIKNGEVTVNGKVVTELGTKADAAKDHIKVRGKLINTKLTAAKEKTYILLNKPKGYLSSAADPEKRPLVVDLVRGLGRPAAGRIPATLSVIPSQERRPSASRRGAAGQEDENPSNSCTKQSQRCT